MKAVLTKVCEYCKKRPKTKEDNLKVCSKCNITAYCNRECQVKDWENHKVICKSRVEIGISINTTKHLLRQLFLDCYFR